MAERLILIRHGQVEERFAGRFVGSTDAALSPEGLRQAQDLASWLVGKKPGVCFCSPLQRCVETARAAVAGFQLQPVLDPDLREVDFGEWEGLSFSEIAGKDAAAVDRWARFEPGFRFPGGESIADFTRRINAAADRMAAAPQETVVAITHGGVIRFMLCSLLRLDPRSAAAFEIRPAGVVELALFEGGALLQGLGNVREIGVGRECGGESRVLQSESGQMVESMKIRSDRIPQPACERRLNENAVPRRSGWSNYRAKQALNMGAIILITGGSRSGKSAYALRFAESRPGPWTFVATCPSIDEEMARKIEAHKQERDALTWTTIEEEIDLAGAIERAGAGVVDGAERGVCDDVRIAARPAGVILVDCLTLWINNLMYRASLAGREVTEEEVAGLTDAVVRAARRARGTVIFVTNEVGLGIVPPDAPARLYRNLVGRCGQAIAAAADAAVYVVCGLPINLKGDPSI